MDHAVYVGPLEEFRGREALVQPDDTYELPLAQRTLRAQFNGTTVDPETGVDWSRGWHTFPVTHFHLILRAHI